MNKRIFNEIKDKNVNQFFEDATYRCLPPTLRAYRLYIIY